MAKSPAAPSSATGRSGSTEPIAAGVFAFEGDWDSDLRKQWSIDTMLDGRAEGRVIHFGSCSVMRARDDRLRTFRHNTRARAVIGYRKTVYSNLELAAFELLLLEALSKYSQTGAPARHLRSNYKSLCDKLGFEYIY